MSETVGSRDFLSDTLELSDDSEIRNFGARTLQKAVRRFIVRSRIYKILLSRYEKIYDPVRKAYFYYDTQSDTSSWRKPKLLLGGDINKISPTYTKDAAAVMIQRQLWRVSSLNRVRQLYSESVTKIKDESTGSTYYYNPRSGYTSWDLPSFMGGKLLKPKEKRQSKTHDDDKNQIHDTDGYSTDSNSDDSEIRIEKRRLERKYPRCVLCHTALINIYYIIKTYIHSLIKKIFHHICCHFIQLFQYFIYLVIYFYVSSFKYI